MIENLTNEQEALMPIYRENWLNIALSTELIVTKKLVTIIDYFNEINT